jgi:large subunit ribosomal protein L30
MIKKAKDYVTWGEIDRDTLKELILTSGEFVNNGRVTEEEIKKRTGMDADTFVEKVLSGEVKLSDYLKPFRLHPPRKGYRNTKLPYPEGALGYRGDKINELLRRMM